MMEGFGVHTFRLVNDQGQSTFVKFHWKPKLGVHSLVWDEAQRTWRQGSGLPPPRPVRDAIDSGIFPEYELGFQLVPETDELNFDFDLLDPTKIIPEDQVPVTPVGKMTLNRNPVNFFMETEQAAFHLGHVVPGIDFSNDPLLQGRLFSYLDTQINRFNGTNFQQLPINQTKAPVNNYQQDGYMRMPTGRARSTMSRTRWMPRPAREAKPEEGGFVSYPAPTDGTKVRSRSETFGDHYSQATLFYNSMSAPEKQHITQALQFELGTREEHRRAAAHGRPPGEHRRAAWPPTSAGFLGSDAQGRQTQHGCRQGQGAEPVGDDQGHARRPQDRHPGGRRR